MRSLENVQSYMS